MLEPASIWNVLVKEDIRNNLSGLQFGHAHEGGNDDSGRFPDEAARLFFIPSGTIG